MINSSGMRNELNPEAKISHWVWVRVDIDGDMEKHEYHLGSRGSSDLVVAHFFDWDQWLDHSEHWGWP